ncbi:hypothetical protein GF325_13810, partial [Candidatus Bathyarchaeota archaeon]|nr:hypothetical protein [Candidatus Bathyarchaeota archaeon]
IIGFLILIAVTIWLAVVWIMDRQVFARWTVEFLIIPVIKIGVWGFALFLGIMVAQGLLMPIPSEIVLLTTGLLWGILGGTIIGVIGSMLAAWACYFLVLKGGRPIAEKFISQKVLDPLDNLIDKYGAWFIFLARAVPLMAFDPISFASGLLKVDWKKFSIATLMGSIIRGVFYAWLGSIMLPKDAFNWDVSAWVNFMTSGEFDDFAKQFNIILITIVIILVGFFLVYHYVISPYISKRGKKIEEEEGGAQDGDTFENEQVSTIRKPDEGTT